MGLRGVLGIVALGGDGEGGSGGAQGHGDVAVYSRVLEVKLADQSRIGLYLLQTPDDLFESLYLFFPTGHQAPPLALLCRGRDTHAAAPVTASDGR
jgi:hypothetical protein